jgi:hypothetical protein
MPQNDNALFYQLYFSPRRGQTEFERDVRLTIRKILYSASGDAPRPEGGEPAADAIDMVARQGGFLSRMVDPASLPSWLTEADLEFYVREFARTGFRGGLSWLGWSIKPEPRISGRKRCVRTRIADASPARGKRHARRCGAFRGLSREAARSRGKS